MSIIQPMGKNRVVMLKEAFTLRTYYIRTRIWVYMRVSTSVVRTYII